ncbi:hypothetical protein [Gillisia sp. Hel_I_29]|uniref:hypothetical protein n=1 Tax=Gillisia sp. Hel_I_29 TaxID=1249975 RepID=UPI0005551765|nr:hypothetical protein [Gillisia sp. Hel_I_29]
MQQKNYIEFKEERDLGAILSDTFSFFRQNFKPLFKIIFKIAGPAFLLLVAALTYYSYMVSGGNSPATLMQSRTAEFSIAFLVFALALLIFYSSLYATVLNYIKSYIINNGMVVEEEIKQGHRNYFAKFFLFFIVSAILVIAGLFLLVLPGIYLMVPLSIGTAVMIFNEESLTETISSCLHYIKDNWWYTFFTLIVFGILIYIIGYIFQLPAVIYTVMGIFTKSGEVSAATAEADWVFVILNVFGSIVNYLLATVSVICISFIYFSLNEKKNFTGTYENIDNLGN